MAAANVYGVTSATLQAFVSDLTINSSTSPSTTDVTAMILAEASAIRGLCSYAGITTDGMTSDDDAYPILNLVLTNKACAALLRARNRGIDAEGYAKEAAMLLDRLIKRPQQVSSNAENMSVETVSDWITRTGNTAGQDTWDKTPAGRIVGGGSL